MAGRLSRLLLTLWHALSHAALACVLAAAGLLAGCSSAFFFPDNITYVTPGRLNLDYEDVFLKTSDGETLHGWWLPAATSETEPLGTVYFLHGNAQNLSSHILNVAWLPEQGYNVFALDYRGYGQSTGAPDIEGVLNDVETGLNWLGTRPEVQSGGLFVLGQSLGGALGLTLASEWVKRGKEPEIDGVVIDGAFSGFRGIAQEKLGSFWLTWPLQIPLSWTIPDDYEGVDRIDDISPVPVLVIHSLRDEVIPFHHGKALYEAADYPKELIATDTPHGATFIISAHRESTMAFFANASAKHAQAPAAPKP
ncbi:alpha/beta hydrolase [Marinobacter salinisoli]|uniref:Alpha/beta hydrolase n=1 Tax=Marinobacter salinisoli TaxID=2769486 RepID=A0ABX7MRQ1_9GAMM|nr:alpha/beta hydrolase [Marinobacter salinisoli]QSP95040.1 alpha/beta hydrolase [Marinobacter salinisoli]